MEDRPLSVVLREATAAAHRQAERHVFVSAMLRGTLPRERYAAYLSSMRAVYAALESALAPGSPFADPAIARTDAIVRDLGVLETTPPPGPTATRWAAHLQRLPQHKLAGHAYTRYLGDLSGGQQIGRRLVATGMLPADATHFYRFPRIREISLYKDSFRRNLDVLGVQIGAAGCAEVTQEARHAFDWSAAVFDDVTPR